MPKPATEIDLAHDLAEIFNGACKRLSEPERGLVRIAFMSGATAVLDAIEDYDTRDALLAQMEALLPPA